MRENLKRSLVINFGHEGGYVNRKTDAGGPTKYGITIKTLSDFLGRPASIAEVQNLSLSVAEEIYRRLYWPMAGCDQLPAGLDYAVFNTATMSGVSRSVKLLQIVLQARGLYDRKIDGHFGPATLNGVNQWSAGTEDLIKTYVLRHLEFCRRIKGSTGWASNGRGWEYRLTGKDPKGVFKDQPGVIGYALQMYRDYRQRVDSFPSAKAEKVVPMERPAEINDQMETQALPSKPTVTDVAGKPETISSITAIISTILSAASDSQPLQYALAVVVVIAASTAAYTFYRRFRREVEVL